ncbi:MAG: colanic acid biosynthesis glycosyltransferase WcaL [Bryobacteraceae bacterium]|nr:MAG: colanic acid biosynthesis glycosyltransferase WcaL [Bryobacteraceae bacterium]
MRIVMVCPSFPKTSETFLFQKAAGLMERGHEVTVVCGSSEEREWERFRGRAMREELRKRVRVAAPVRPRWKVGLHGPVVLAKSLRGDARAAGRYLGAGRRGLRDLYLDAEILAARPEVVHFEFGAAAVGRMHLKERLGCKVVVSFRGYDLNFAGLDDPRFYEEVWEKADGIHCLGEDLWRRAQRRGCPPEKLHALIPPAIDAEFFRRSEPRKFERTGTNERPLRLLSVGRLEWKKGYEFALEAAQRVRAAGVEIDYRIVGDGSYYEAVVFARHQLGLREVVTLCGAMDREGVRREMERADVFVHAAVSEGFCNAVLEAQAMELPVVCSDAGGLPENVANGETGFVTRRRHPKEMAERILELAGDAELRRKMGEAGRERVARHFRVEEQIRAFEEFYGRVVG